jgi:hypothetical protein
MTTTVKPIRALLNFRTMPDADLQARATAVLTGMTGSAIFPNPPVDLNALKSSIDAFAAGIAESLDGSKKVIAAKNKEREALIKMLRLLAIYAETHCDDDPAAFATSGFQAASNTRTFPQPLAQPVIKRIEQGSISGELLVRIAALQDARCYELRHAVVANGMPGQWTTVTITIVKTAVSFKGLTPGTIYAFDVRALGKLGFTDRSDFMTRMVI